MNKDNITIQIPDVHIGNEVLAYLSAKDISKSKLARGIGMATTNLCRLLRRKSIETRILVLICNYLEHNFFLNWCEDIQLSQPLYTPIENPDCIGEKIDQRIRQLKMTQMEFSTAIGIARSDVNRILRKTSFETDKLIAISEALDYNFFKDFYGPVADSEEKQLEQLNTSTLKRYEELVIENDRLKQRVFQLENENRQLKDEISKMKSQ